MLRLEMLQVARRAPEVLGEATELVVGFVQSQLTEDGGVANRAGATDLYYTVFGVQALLALGQPLPAERLAAYLGGFGDGAELDLVHLASLARCWACLPAAARAEAPREAMARGLERHRRADGGYAPGDGSQAGTVYGAFLALGAYQDLGYPDALPEPERLMAQVLSQRAADGGFGNRPGMPVGLTPPTTAAASVLRHLTPGGSAAIPRDQIDLLARWLLARMHPEGGFHASPRAPLPDLLSTATALHALAGLQISLAPIQEHCLDYVDTLWTNRGAFFGHWADDAADVEYTFYALLALGHLA